MMFSFSNDACYSIFLSLLQEDAEKDPMKRNRLKYLDTLLKLNLYAKTASRMLLLSMEQSMETKEPDKGGKFTVERLWLILTSPNNSS